MINKELTLNQVIAITKQIRVQLRDELAPWRGDVTLTLYQVRWILEC